MKSLTTIFSIVIIFVFSTNIIAQPFIENNIGIKKMVNIARFVDIDMDGDLDIPVDSVWINNGGTFTKTFFGSSMFLIGDWGDFDNDGDLDVLAGTNLYRNNGSVFTPVTTGFPVLSSSYSSWGDYDNDGLLDVVLMGSNGPSQYSYIFHNNGGTFTNINANLGGLCSGHFDWGDYDKDGDLDLLMEGGNYAGYNQSAIIFRNDNGTFTNINAGLVVNGNSEPAIWVDYDNDGDLDVAIENKIYQNNNGIFTPITTPFISAPNGLSCGDYDNDGDKDFAIINLSNGTKIYQNNGTFSDISAGIIYNGPLLGGGGSSLDLLTWGDYDNDGNLDLMVSGDKGGYNYSTRLFHNNNATVNNHPNVPTGLTSTINGNNVTFKWNRASDAETPAPGLSYNIFIGTSPGVSDLYPAHANLSTGKRYIPFRGMIQDTTITIHLNNLSACTNYYWSVQAIDAGLEGSAFAPVQSFQLPLQANASSDISIICGENTQLNVTTNYSGTLSYLWSNGSTLTNPGIQNPYANPEVSTLYYVTVTDGINCTDMDSINVTVNNLIVNAGSDVTFSCGSSVQLNAVTNSGSSSVTFSWLPATDLNNVNIHNPIASPMDTTYYMVEVNDGSTCTNSDTLKVTPTLSNLTYPGICMVGIDPAFNNNLVIWEKPVTTLISDFIVYKESTQAGVYYALDTIPYSNESIFLDQSSDATLMAYRYKIASIDACGNRSSLSSFHKTIHLTINQGAGTNWNLIWSPYEGFTFSTYNIYRGTSAGSMYLIAQVQSNLFSFTNDPGPGVYYYQIEAVNPNICNTNYKTTYFGSKSNIVNTLYNNLSDNLMNQQVTIFPNPAKDKIIISTNYISKNTRISIQDTQGKILLEQSTDNNHQFEFLLNGISKGLYLVKIETDNSVTYKKIVIQ